MASVAQYYPGDFWSDVKQTLAWLYSRQNAPIAGWQGDATGTMTTAQFTECGIVSTPDFSTFPQTTVENIVIDPPPGVTADGAPGPDGFPINFSPQGLPQGNLLLNTFQNAGLQTVSGRCFSLLQAPAGYRVDVFARTDQFYYQGSSPLTSLGSGTATWSVPNINAGAVIAVLYPATVQQPASGASFATLPIGWVAHSNTGVGQKLSAYFGRVYSKTDIEYLQEDNIPIIVQDGHHARCGSSVIPAAGTMTLHILYNDPVVGPTLVFTSLQNLAVYEGLARSFTVPTSDPLYVPDVTATNSPALQNRSFIYDDALFIIACCQAGNFTAANKAVKQLNNLLDNPGYLASKVLENAEDGLTNRWTPLNGTVSNVAANSVTPQEPPYGAGNIIKFHSTAAGATFTYAGAGFPDSADTELSFEHYDTSPSTNFWTADIGVTTNNGKVTDIQVNNNALGPATYNATTRMITVPIGFVGNNWRVNLLNLTSLVSSLVSGATITSINSYKVTLNYLGDFYLDNLSVGSLQPANSLSFSYDTYYGQIDQAYIRAGAMAWVCYAYAVYMAMSLDYSPALYLQRMLNFLLTLQSTANDLTNGLFYLGYGKYQDPGYQFLPGLQTAVSTEHQVDIYFAFKRAALVLPTAATQLLKSSAVSSAQAAALGSTATQVSSIADSVQTRVLANLYIAPGADPGHFAQGVTGSTLDTSQALDASGAWSALLCHAVGRDDLAAQCAQFAYQKFYLTGQTIVLSNGTTSWNEAYTQQTPFSGFKPYNDSSGGYSGSPLSVWQEGTWGMILALLVLHDVPAVSAYFASVAGSIDNVLTALITDQRTVRSTTGDGSLLGYSLAARALPYEFEVWPMLSGTAWFWITAMNPSLLLSVATNPQTLPYLITPEGQSASAQELDGHSSVAALHVESIDPGGVVKGLASQSNFVGRVAQLRMGFPGQALGDFVTVETRQITATGFTANGKLTIESADVQRFTAGAQLWLNGGPVAWTIGQPSPAQPSGVAVTSNAFAVSDQNPRWISGNPLDLYLAAMQNELGVGQDPSVPASAWAIYDPTHPTTLINPNPYLDVPGITALRDGPFSGDWFEFKITRPVDAKGWLEDQILKVLGLYAIARADGRLSLKSMKSPQAANPVMAFNQTNVMGIPDFARLPVINFLTVRFGVDDSQRETAARQYAQEVTFQQASSVAQYRQQFKAQTEANGLRIERGGMLRAFVLADRVFRRHAFGTPQYRVRTQLATLPVELGDFVWLNHPLVPDLSTGQVGLTNVVCEVVERQPHYRSGSMEFGLLDTRFMALTAPYSIAPLAAGVPSYLQATPSQRQQYMFISLAATGGLNPDGTSGNTIF
ncbi:MAG TPA: hypothetical protein VGW33_15345 [Terriglobia bacterium]|nr:hypothetical protein [Terriglobia bacterium]